MDCFAFARNDAKRYAQGKSVILRGVNPEESPEKRSFTFVQDDIALYSGISITRHCDERSEEAIQERDTSGFALNCRIQGHTAHTSPVPFVSMTEKSKKAAFTLAEVLITLGIIGIVAAMTMPSLLANYRQRVIISQLKKSFSTLQTAINTTNVEYGMPYDCYNIGWGGYHVTQCSEFWNDFLKQLKIIKSCRYTDDSCGVKYKTKDQVLAEGGSIFNSTCSFFDKGPTDYIINILADGSYIITYGGKNPLSNHYVYFGIDVNGEKGPNKWGYDLFYLMLNRENSNKDVVAMTEVCELKEKGGSSFTELLLK